MNSLHDLFSGIKLRDINYYLAFFIFLLYSVELISVEVGMLSLDLFLKGHLLSSDNFSKVKGPARLAFLGPHA